MATSGTTAFGLDILDIIEEAYEMVGVNVRAGYELKTARRSLDLLTKEWANRGQNMWTIEETSASIAASAVSETLETDTIDVLDVLWRTGSGTTQSDRTMTRMAVTEWSHIANKNQTGKPSMYWINRLVGGPVLYMWPVPEEAGTLVYYKMRRMEDTGAYTNTMDIPPRFYPAMTTGLAYYLAMKTPDAADRIQMLQMEYERQFRLASEEDREKASIRLVPDCS